MPLRDKCKNDLIGASIHKVAHLFKRMSVDRFSCKRWLMLNEDSRCIHSTQASPIRNSASPVLVMDIVSIFVLPRVALICNATLC